MFTLKKSFTFEASHQLVHHDGKCQRLHGHSFVVDIEVAGAELHQEGPKQYMLMDYSDLKAQVAPVIDQLDHYHLNDVLGMDMPTSEYLAKWIFDVLKSRLPLLRAVTVHETCTSECRYEPQYNVRTRTIEQRRAQL